MHEAIVPLNIRTDIGGVCWHGKTSRGRDPTMIRLFRAVVTALSFGIAIIIFILAWITIPEEDDGV